MKCKRCKKKAVIEIKRHNTAFCSDCFLHYYSKQVERNITHYKMFDKNDRILVAVSGGKDSMAVWHILATLGYNVSGLFIDLGIGEYSKKSRNVVARFSEKLHIPLIVKDIKKEYNLDIKEVSKRLHRKPCSVCGNIKRYLFNKIAFEEKFDVVVTGHNLDDEAATLFGNVLNWDIEYLKRQSPVLPKTHQKFIKKVKPLFTLTERENLYYVLLNKIEFLHEECEYSKGARSILLKEVLNKLEEESPGSKQRFLLSFLKFSKYLNIPEEKEILKECRICGQPTSADICSFCRILEYNSSGRVTSLHQ